MSFPFDKYTSHEYLEKNPSWDIEDSPWKAKNVARMIDAIGHYPASICEVGCGAGGILANLRASYPISEIYGYDIAPDATRFWKNYEELNINFNLGDVFSNTDRTYDVLLLLDLIEHLPNPFEFLQRLLKYSKYFVFHIPLDLSASSVLRETPLLRVRKKVGHIHFYTKNLALALLNECNYNIIHWEYTGACFEAPQRNLRTKLSAIPRRLIFSINRDWGARLLGGETLMILAEPRSSL